MSGGFAFRSASSTFAVCAFILLVPSAPPGAAAIKMSAMDRLFWRPNPAFTDLKGKDGDFLRFEDDYSSSSHMEEWCRVEQKPVKEGSTKGRYQATRRIYPISYVKSGDPDHPNMRTNVRPGEEHQMNLQPENTFWKDHDSEQDGGHPNANVLTVLEQNSTEMSEAFWENLKELDVERYRGDNYNATIEKYGLKDFAKISHLVPKLWFEPLSSSEEEDIREQASIAPPDSADFVPHKSMPFCSKCNMMLGVARPELNNPADFEDPHCRFCGYVNAHDGTGRILNDPEIDLLEFMPSGAVIEAQHKQNDEWFRLLDEGYADPRENVRMRKETEQRCGECGFGTAYYWTAQVRSMDEGQTAFFECKKCKHSWNVQ